MKEAIQQNPFAVTTYIGSEYFCDRKDETKNIIQNLTNGNSVTLIVIRRIGKTGLIHHVLHKLPRSVKSVYVDILDTENMNQFLNRLSTSIITQFPERTGYGKKIWAFIKSLRPVINFDPLTGAPQASFTISAEETEININAVFQFLEQQEHKVVIAIDEFQQILQYPEKNTDAWLRTRIQSLKNINFIFSGSQQQCLHLAPSRQAVAFEACVPCMKCHCNRQQALIFRQLSGGKRSRTWRPMTWCGSSSTLAAAKGLQ